MVKKDKLEFDKMISRNWSVLFCQIWLETYTNEFKRQFGWDILMLSLKEKIMWLGCIIRQSSVMFFCVIL